MKRCAIDCLYVFNGTRFKKISERVQPGEFRYRIGHELLKSREGEVTRYVKTFKVGGVKKSLFFNTLSPNKTKADMFMAASIDEIGKDPRLLTIFNKAGKKPLELPLKYV